ncbi:unnamed protein product [Meganyctiphanes norvegica]|uniref:Uncharacterized protein n=1 Tax=Meganyctiphanes norvegica TaxID=48144 RepID=A0AAV2RPE2_MEGNR
MAYIFFYESLCRTSEIHQITISRSAEGCGVGYILENIIKSALMVLLGNNLWSYIDIIDIIYLYRSQNMQNTSIFSTIILFTTKQTWRRPCTGLANATCSCSANIKSARVDRTYY